MRRLLTAFAVAFVAAVFAPSAFAQGEGGEGGAGVAGGGVELLRGFLERTPAAQITLAREVWDAEGNKREAGTARLMLLRPDKFRLEHDGDEGLLIVSDGETVWTYEADLAQAIRRPYASARRMGALAMLAGEAPESHFVLAAAAAADANGARWVTATPRAGFDSDSDAGVNVRIGFSADGELFEMRIADAFGGTVRLVVKGLTRVAPSESVFEFHPPEGVAVVAEDG